MTHLAQPSPPPSLTSLLAELDHYGARVPLELLEEWIAELDLPPESLEAHMRFDPLRYCRNCVRTAPAYEALLLCWRPGQSSPIHDHRGSSCVFRIVSGVATETRFAATGLEATPVDERVLTTGSVCGSLDDDIHELANRGTTDLVSLHVYSPPLVRMRIFERREALRVATG